MYQGHKNWNHWNVSLWLNNDEPLYVLMLRFVRFSRSRSEAAARMLAHLRKEGREKTPDGAPFSQAAILAAMKGIDTPSVVVRGGRGGKPAWRDVDDVEGCPLCGGELQLLGQLGDTTHFRCRNCGGTFAKRPRRNPIRPHRSNPRRRQSSR